MPTGTIKKLIAEKGFGFIAAADGSKDLFFHRDESENFESLQEGQSVQYEVGQSDKGPKAVKVAAA